MLVRLALRYVGDQATAEDVTQETWLHVLRGLSRFQFRSTSRPDREHPEHRARTRASASAALAGQRPCGWRWPTTNPPWTPTGFSVLKIRVVDRWASAPRGVAPEEHLMATETQAIICVQSSRCRWRSGR